MILDLEPDDDLDNQDNPNQSDLIEQAAEMLYGNTFVDSSTSTSSPSRSHPRAIHFNQQWYRTNVRKIPKWRLWLLSTDLLWQSADVTGKYSLADPRLHSRFRLVCLRFLAKPWWNSIVRNAWTFTHRRVRDIIIPMELISARAFLICYLWFIRNIVQNGQPINMLHVYMALKSIQWLINCNIKLQRILNNRWARPTFQIVPEEQRRPVDRWWKIEGKKRSPRHSTMNIEYLFPSTLFFSPSSHPYLTPFSCWFCSVVRSESSSLEILWRRDNTFNR